MRYTRKDISLLLGTVEGGPDVVGCATSAMLGSTYVLTASGPQGTAWQDLYNPSHRICSEDGASTSITEDIGHVAC